MLKKSLCIIVLFWLFAAVSFGQVKKTRGANKNEKLITALIDSAEVRGMFGNDAMYIYTQSP